MKETSEMRKRDRKRILLVSTGRRAVSAQTLQGALTTIGRTRVVSQARAAGELGRSPYDVVVIDDGGMKRTLSLLARLKRRLGRAAVVVVKDDVSWQDARALLLAGAADVVFEPPGTKMGIDRLGSSLRVLLQG
jgi:DNA-binding NarL/FixJ family response regulator